VLRSVGWTEAGDGGLQVGYAAPGDGNVDGIVDILDAAGVLAGGKFDSWSASVWNEGDFNQDSIVDILDAADFVSVDLFDRGDYVSAVGAGTAAGVAAVPEPSSFGWLAVAAAAVILAQRRSRSSGSPIA
jgi:hypothetical protein